MQGYWKSDSLQFMSNRGVNHGWQEALDGYKKGYPDIAAMGTLSFELLEIRPLSQINYPPLPTHLLKNQSKHPIQISDGADQMEAAHHNKIYLG